LSVTLRQINALRYNIFAVIILALLLLLLYYMLQCLTF